jgi:hypothetical protein
MDVKIKFQVLPYEVELVEAYSVVDNNAVDKAAEEDMFAEEEPAATVAVTVCIQYQTNCRGFGPSSFFKKIYMHLNVL